MAQYEKTFDEKFEQVGALRKTKSGKGWSAKLARTVSEGEYVMVFRNNRYNIAEPSSPEFYIYADRLAPVDAEPNSAPPPAEEEPQTKKADDEEEVPF